MTGATPDMKLKELARKAILRAQGDTERARDIFNESLIAEDSAALERSLCEAYRNVAIRAVLVKALS